MTATLVLQPHLVTTQKQVVAEVERRLKTTPSTVEEPLILADPFGMSPLTALICFQTTIEDQFVVTVQGKTAHSDLSYASQEATAHRIPVIGLYAGAETVVQLRNRAGETWKYILQAPPLPETVPTYTVADAGTYNALVMFLPADDRHLPCAFDADGNCRWFLDRPLAHRIHLDREGFLLCGAPPSLAPPYSPTALWQLDLLGHIRKEFRFPGGACCDFLQLPERDIVTIGQDVVSGTVADHVHWIAHQDGAVKRSLALRDVLPDLPGTPAQSGTDWFQARSLQYHDEAHSVTVCGVAQNIIVNMDAATARPLTVMIPPHERASDVNLPEGTKAIIVDYLQEPYGAVLKDDKLQVLCANRFDEQNNDIRLPLQIITADLANDGASPQVLDAGFPVSPLFNDFKRNDESTCIIHAGSCARLPDGTSPAVPGVFNRLRYPETELWSEWWVGSEQSGWVRNRLNTNSLHGEMIQVPALRFMPFQESGQVLGKWDEQPEVDVAIPVESNETLDADNAVHLWCDDARLYLRGVFFQGEMCLLVLRQGEHEKKYFMQTSRKPYGADWLYSYTDGMERPVTWAVPVSHLAGTWTIGVQIDDVYYGTGHVIHI